MLVYKHTTTSINFVVKIPPRPQRATIAFMTDLDVSQDAKLKPNSSVTLKSHGCFMTDLDVSQDAKLKPTATLRMTTFRA